MQIVRLRIDDSRRIQPVQHNKIYKYMWSQEKVVRTWSEEHMLLKAASSWARRERDARQDGVSCQLVKRGINECNESLHELIGVCSVNNHVCLEMQWRRKRRILYVIGSAHHALLVKQYREDGVCSNNEDELEGDRDSTSPTASRSGASGLQRASRASPRGAGSYNYSYSYRHRLSYHHHHQQQLHTTNEGPQHQTPVSAAEKRTFNEEEYTKITTPRQDVLFKKGYLGRKRLPTASASAPAAESTAVSVPDAATPVMSEGGVAAAADDPNDAEAMETPFVYATNGGGYVDQPGGLYFVNGSGYELYDPYSGNVTIVVGPAPHFGGPGGGPPVLAAVPCQPLPLQPLEWFNPAFLPYVSAPCHNGLASARDRRKRYSTDSQNCSPQSSESTEPPGSPPQECEHAQSSQPAAATAAYVYPGYMFGPPVYNVNGVTLQGAPTQAPSCEVAGSSKRRKKKRRKRRRRGGAEDGCSEESSSDEKELEEPMSVTSQESSSQEIEFDSKESINCGGQTLTPADDGNSQATEGQNSAFDSQTPLLFDLQKETKEDISSDRKNCNSKETSDDAEENFSTELLKDIKGSENFILHLSTEENGFLPCPVAADDNKDRFADAVATFLPEVKIENGTESVVQCNGGSSKVDESTKVNKQKKSGKQHKKNVKAKEVKPKRPTKLSNSDAVQKKCNKNKEANCTSITIEENHREKEVAWISNMECKTASDIMNDCEARIFEKTKSNESTPEKKLPGASSISLRPDGPRFETRTLTPSQLKCTTDILDSITEALIKVPTLCEPKDQKALIGGSVVHACKLSPSSCSRKHTAFDLKDAAVVEEGTTTHESEELSSSTDDRRKMDDEVKYTENEMMDVKSIPPDKCTPSISGPSRHFSEQQEFLSPGSVKDINVKLYADALSKILVCEAIHEASKKKCTLPITEAVTRWLRSQSPEVLSCPSAEDESESDVSLDERGGDEKEMTGQKNVLCNPLPAPSLEDYDSRRGCSDVAGRRVALFENDSVYGNDDNNEIAASSLTSGNQNKSYCSLDTYVIKSFSSNIQSGCTKKKSILHSNGVGSIAKDCKPEFGIATAEIRMNSSFKLGEKKNMEKKKDEEEEEEDDFSFTSDETLECEWDHWDCSPEKPVSLKNLAKNPNPIDEGPAKSSEDYCSQNYDPAISVAKYYSLGTRPETENDCSEDETDALKHFRHEFEDEKYRNLEIYKSHYGEGGPSVCFEYENVRNMHERNSFVISRLKGAGPFPCGGICCILQ
ncbi:hypothetical protein C0J52_00887 [Blattella germanica]|nr:hypothetical protein C0J52_00887 [Blattella germanica]